MPLDAKTLRTEFTTLHGEATGVIEAAEKDKRELSDEEKTANERRFTRMKAIKAALDEEARFAGLALADAPNAPAGGTVTKPQDAPGREEFDAATAADRQEFARKTGESDEAYQFRFHRHAVNQFIRTGREPGKQFTLITTSGSGVLLPTNVGAPVVIKRVRNPIRAALLARGLQVIRTDDMGLLNVPVFDDSANPADVIAENNTSENNKDPSTSGLALGAGLYDSGTVWASNTLLSSLNFDLLAYLEPMLEARIAAAELSAWFTYLLANATVGKTTASTNGVTYAELLDWQHSIPLQYRDNGVFFVSDGLLRVIRGLVDTTGQPIFQASLRDDVPDTLLGWPIFPTTALATPATGVTSGVAASAEALVVRDVNNKRIARYQNIPTHPDQFGIREFSNGDFKFVSNAVRTLKHA